MDDVTDTMSMLYTMYKHNKCNIPEDKYAVKQSVLYASGAKLTEKFRSQVKYSNEMNY